MPGGRPRKAVPAPAPPPRRKHGTGSVVYHPRTGTWRARLPAALASDHPETYHPTREAAERHLADELARHAQHAAAATRRAAEPEAGWTFGDWLDHWYRITAASASWTGRTRAIYADHLWQFAAVHDVPLDELTTTRLQAVVATLVETGAARRPGSRSTRPIQPLGPSAVREAVSTIRRALDRARDDGLIRRNPAAGLVTPRVVRSRPPLWTAEERARIAAQVDGDDLEALWRLLFELGLRIGEALALRWDDAVDLDRRVVIVRRIVFKDGRVQEWPKGRRWREVDLTTRAHAAFEGLRARQAPGTVWVFERIAPRKSDRPWTYQGVRYRPLWSYDGVRYRLQRMAERAGVAYKPSHNGRHMLASHLIELGVPLPAVAERLGHVDASITARIYAHASPASRQRALEAAETSLSGGVSGGVLAENSTNEGTKEGIDGQDDDPTRRTARNP